MKEIKAPILDAKTYEVVEQAINKVLWEGIFKEIDSILKENKIETKKILNQKTTFLEKAIAGNRVFLKHNQNSITLTGVFNSKIVKELQSLGATYNKASRSWNLLNEKIPQSVLSINSITLQRNIRTHESIISSLNIENVEKAIKQNIVYTSLAIVTKKLESDWRKASQILKVSPEFTDAQRENITREYTENLNLSIKNFSDKKIPEMRLILERNIADGARANQLVSILQKQYGFSQNRANFIAKQETRLLKAQYHKERALVSGSKKFRWLTSNDNSVRDDHKRLNKTVHFINNPPVINTKTGQTGLPGQDYSCRCVAVYLF